jgi:PBP1b-binding outer membrane lipoprotein LpoB
MKKPVKASRISILILPLLFLLYCTGCNEANTTSAIKATENTAAGQTTTAPKTTVTAIDTADYNKRMLALCNNDTTGKWPVKTPYPLPGALFPYNRF